MISTLLAAAGAETPDHALLLVGLALLALPIGVGFLIFRRGSIRGPDRLPADEPVGRFFLIMAGGLFAWLMTMSVYMTWQGSRATTKGPIELSPKQSVALNMTACLVGFVVLVAANLGSRKDGIKRLGFSVAHFFYAIPKAIVGSLFIMPLMLWIGDVTMRCWKVLHLQHADKHDMLLILDKTPDAALRMLVIVSAIVAAPLFEELFFRGHLQTLIRRVTGRPWVAVVLVSLLFASVHPWWTQPPIFFLALCLGYIYERTGNLWSAVLIHAAFNGLNVWATMYGRS
jgi:membrane protease YdiL (CAAX protease family)